jgi:ABC-2 type transport system permease protein
VFAAIRRTLAFDKRLVFADYRQPTLIAAKTLAICHRGRRGGRVHRGRASGVLGPGPGGLAGHPGRLRRHRPHLRSPRPAAVLGVLVKGDLEGFFLIIMGSLMDTFLQNPIGNPVANKQILQWFPSFGPMQFAVGEAFGTRPCGATWPSAWPGPAPSPRPA